MQTITGLSVLMNRKDDHVQCTILFCIGSHGGGGGLLVCAWTMSCRKNNISREREAATGVHNQYSIAECVRARTRALAVDANKCTKTAYGLRRVKRFT